MILAGTFVVVGGSCSALLQPVAARDGQTGECEAQRGNELEAPPGS